MRGAILPFPPEAATAAGHTALRGGEAEAPPPRELLFQDLRRAVVSTSRDAVAGLAGFTGLTGLARFGTTRLARFPGLTRFTAGHEIPAGQATFSLAGLTGLSRLAGLPRLGGPRLAGRTGDDAGRR
jgi:hypothetical protein